MTRGVSSLCYLTSILCKPINWMQQPLIINVICWALRFKHIFRVDFRFLITATSHQRIKLAVTLDSHQLFFFSLFFIYFILIFVLLVFTILNFINRNERLVSLTDLFRKKNNFIWTFYAFRVSWHTYLS